MSTFRVSMFAVALTGLIAVPASAATAPALRCESGKDKAAGKYSECRQKAEAKYATSLDAAVRTAALQKCLDKYNETWAELEAKAVLLGGVCRTLGDEAAIQGVVDAHTTNVATALGGGALETDLASCLDDAATCSNDLAACELFVPHFPATGQTTCHDTGAEVPCPGTGRDGESQAGTTLSFTDNGDGTITDHATGLMWEKLSDDGSIHDVSNAYTWEDAFAVKVATLNGGSFAGYTDWRLPNVKEVQTLQYYGAPRGFAGVAPVFSTGCMPGCTVLTCSCTINDKQWSSTTNARNTDQAWVVWFTFDITLAFEKDDLYFVRAVRGGS